MAYRWWYPLMVRMFHGYCEQFPDKSTPNLMERTCMDMNEHFPGFRGGFDHSHVVDALQWHSKKAGAR